MIIDLKSGKKYVHKTMKWVGEYISSDNLDYEHTFLITKSSTKDYRVVKKGDIHKMETGFLQWLEPIN